MAKPLKAWLL